MKNNDVIDDEDFNITDHLEIKEGKPWEQTGETYTIKKLPELIEYEHVPIKTCEPWYRRFENNKNNNRNNRRKK